MQSVSSSNNISNFNPPNKVEDTRSLADAIITGAIRGSLAGVATFFIALGATASTLNVLALPVALAAALLVGVSVGVASTVANYFIVQPGEAQINETRQKIEVMKAQIDKDVKETERLTAEYNKIKMQTIAKLSSTSSVVASKNEELKQGLESLKITQREGQENDKKLGGMIQMLRGVVENEKVKIVTKNETPEIAAIQIKNTIQILEGHLLTMINQKNATEKGFVAANALLNEGKAQLSKFPDTEEMAKLISEMSLICDERKKAWEHHTKEMTDVVDQMIAVTLENSTKLMSKEDRTKVLAPYANNPKYAHLVPKF